MAFFSHKEIDSWNGDYKETNLDCVGYTGAVVGVLGSRAIVLGGRETPGEDFNETALVLVFDLVTERILYDYDVQGRISRRIGHRVAALPSKASLFVFGGESIASDKHAYESLDDVYRVQMDANILTIEAMPKRHEDEVPAPRAWHSLTLVKYRPAQDATKAKGQAVPAVGEPDEALLLLGGRSSSAPAQMKDAWVYVTADKADEPSDGIAATHKWLKLPTDGASPLPLAHHSCEQLLGGEKVLVFGGVKGAGSSHLNDAINILDLSTGAATWSTLATSPLLATCFHVAVAMSVPVDAANSSDYFPQTTTDAVPLDRILVLGGVAADGAVESSTFLLLNAATGHVDRVTGCLALQSSVGHAPVASPDRRKLYLFGGTAGHSWRNATSVVDLWQYQYEPAPDMSRFEKIRTFQYPNGDVYIGELDPDTDIRRGLGRCTFVDGRVYEGHWADDVFDGPGVMTYANGDIYDGAWQHGTRDGLGKLTIAPSPSTNVAFYEGAWKADARHGSGALGYVNGSLLRGTWASDTFDSSHATIEEFALDSTRLGTFEGEVESATKAPHGHGRFETHGYPSRGEMYAGRWAHGKRDGEGMSMLYDGTIYRGEFKNGKKNGFGTCDYARTRDKYEGKWVGNQRCGQGKCTYAAGFVYDGHWAADQRHGFGRCTYADGTFYEGEWKKDDFTGDGALVLCDMRAPPTPADREL
ncbi:hypothetical protein SDRG_05268 [Saprolegnia diclina VS20]|uniref:Uncharacterized protein n=1 Tax=Saprolegnia diclina (strain VS20) TaxID=1156394 RepID=T0QGF9_SAPDV|nr:hypothetical protein SDRG_05268 [Saprolegnia diclina VS20]EQC37039.1 hypothetical protein SDRG_05268 [Saprolegnia diclina VS20]|eukprot:XP_008609201.1 hypothetical protein SDRG_05268 [Saprolegnia diclina VS20]